MSAGAKFCPTALPLRNKIITIALLVMFFFISGRFNITFYAIVYTENVEIGLNEIALRLTLKHL
jgi:hypothetical protein